MASTLDVLPARYARARLLASGGMGRVFHAVDTELSRGVAVKVLADRYAADEQVRARFRREALAAARLSGNPNIVTIFDVAEYGGHDHASHTSRPHSGGPTRSTKPFGQAGLARPTPAPPAAGRRLRCSVRRYPNGGIADNRPHASQ